MGRAGELGDMQGQGFQPAYFSDLTSLGNAHCTMDSDCPNLVVWIPDTIWAWSKLPSRLRQSLYHVWQYEILAMKKPRSLAA
jgi:hypothetical protein